MNSEYVKQAMQKVSNPNVLINLVSRRVRQLTSGGGAGSRPLIIETAGLGAADIALVELIDEKMGWEMAEAKPAETPVKRRRKSSS